MVDVKGGAPAGAPDLAEVQRAMAAFCVTIAHLRDPKTGCPWDLEQDHQTLRRYMIEEAYEAADAMAANNPAEMRDELGDVLLQVVLNSQVAQDGGTFTLVEVIDGINAKMRRRHPHVFAPTGKIESTQVVKAWDEIKQKERADKGIAAKGLFADAEHKSPASLQALKIGKLASKVKFDWDTPHEVLAQVRSEVDELTEELAAPTLDKLKTAEELGDVYFSLAQLARHLGLDPEVVAVDANRKFLRRFRWLEDLAKQRDITIANASREQLEELWKAVKTLEKSGQGTRV